jgi:serine protease Do
VWCGAVASTSAQPAATRRDAVGVELSEALERTTRVVSPAVVEIHTTAFVVAEADTSRSSDLVLTERGAGSGVVVDAAGYILTNAHVVQGAHRVRVDIPRPPEGTSILAARSRSVPAEIVGLDPETDLAVLKVPVSDLPAIEFGDSDRLRAGQLVLAFGSPLGFRSTVSLGVVSAVARQLEPDAPMIYVQTDAATNPGSSGGPLVDLQGRLVGLNTLIATRGGGFEGVGFAAPANIARTVYQHIRAHGRVRRGDIGIRTQTITPDLARGLGLSRDEGVVVADVLDQSPASEAGLQPGDIVRTLDGRPMENARQLRVGLYRKFVGDVVHLQVDRAGHVFDRAVAMSERPNGVAGLSARVDPRRHVVARLGIVGATLEARIAALLPPLRTLEGVVVLSTGPDAGADPSTSLRPGDVVRAVNGVHVVSLDALRAVVEATPLGAGVVLHLERQGAWMYVPLTLD